jgi:hypothetical protein
MNALLALSKLVGQDFLFSSNEKNCDYELLFSAYLRCINDRGEDWM